MLKNKLFSGLLLIFAALLVTFAGCEKIEDLLRFNFSDSAEISIPAQNILPTGFLRIPSPEVQTSSQQAFANNNTEAKYVKEAILTELKLTITSPQTQTFSFLNEIKIYLSAPDQPEVLIASKTNIPATVGNELLLDVTGTNLKPYVQGDSYVIRTEAKLDEATTQEMKIRADMQFSVTAEVF